MSPLAEWPALGIREQSTTGQQAVWCVKRLPKKHISGWVYEGDSGDSLLHSSSSRAPDGGCTHSTHNPGPGCWGGTGNPEGVLCHSRLRTGRLSYKYFPRGTKNVSAEPWVKCRIPKPELSLWNLLGGTSLWKPSTRAFFLSLCTSFSFLFLLDSCLPFPSRLLRRGSLNPGAPGVPGVMSSQDEFCLHTQGLCCQSPLSHSTGTAFSKLYHSGSSRVPGRPPAPAPRPTNFPVLPASCVARRSQSPGCICIVASPGHLVPAGLCGDSPG